MAATPEEQHNQSTPELLQAHRIKALRLQAGLTVRHAAQAAKVSQPSWSRWELGTRTPTLRRAGDIARALGCPVCALFAPQGFVAVTDVQLTPEAVERVRREGEPAAVLLAAQIAAQLPAMILATCRTNQTVKADGRGKPRRSRAEVLAGIAEANAMRLEAQRRRQTGTGPPQGDEKTSVGGLPYANADSLTAE